MHSSPRANKQKQKHSNTNASSDKTIQPQAQSQHQTQSSSTNQAPGQPPQGAPTCTQKHGRQFSKVDEPNDGGQPLESISSKFDQHQHQQRIKVTLSVPQNPNDDDCQQPSEPILIDSSTAHSESSSASSDEAALAAAAAPATPTGPTFEQQPQERPTPIKKCHSEARATSPANGRQHGCVAESGSAPSSFRQRNRPAKPQPQQQQQEQQQQQQQLLQQPQVASKQLAIYINGKIRSNSIFCQSSSSSAAAGSIGGLFNRAFHHASASSRPAAKARQEERGAGGTASRKQVKAENEESCAASLRHQGEEAQEDFKLNQRSSGRNFFHNYLSVAGGELKRKRTRKRSSKFSLIKRADKARETLSSSPSSSDSELADQQGEEAHTEDRKSEKLSLQASSSFSLTTKEQLREPTTPTSYKLNPSSMFLRKAMRYYRLWIYCTNITILIGTLIFILSTIYVTSDYRFKLLVSPSFVSTATTTTSSRTQLDQESAFHAARRPTGSDQSSEGSDKNNNNNARLNYIDSIKTEEAKEQKVEESTYDIHIKYTEPSVLIAYAVIAIQAGILQAIGCFGAIRMKERWIQTFWYLILALTVFDVVFLLYWLNRYDFIVKSLHHHMSIRLNQHYGKFYTSLHDHKAPNVARGEAAATTLLGGQTYYSASHEPIEPRKSQIPADIEANLDKTLTKIIDKLQADSKCCGISNPFDYKRSVWRRIKLIQLAERLNWTAALESLGLPFKPGIASNNNASERGIPADGDGSITDNPSLKIAASLLRRVPLVPASCCGRTPLSSAESVILLDDSQREKPIRAPAWPPSSSVDDLSDLHQRLRIKKEETTLPTSAVETDPNANSLWTSPDYETSIESANKKPHKQLMESGRRRFGDRLEEDKKSPLSMEEMLDKRWTSHNSDGGQENSAVATPSPDQVYSADIDNLYDNLSKQQRRLLAKPDNYNHRSDDDDEDSEGDETRRRRSANEADRWSVESMVDECERVLSRVIGADGPTDDASQRRALQLDERQALSQQSAHRGARGKHPQGANQSYEDAGDIYREVGRSAESAEAESGRLPGGGQHSNWRLAALRRLLFVEAQNGENQGPIINDAENEGDDDNDDDNDDEGIVDNDPYSQNHFRWPNKLQLNYDQYKVLESYLLSEREESNQQGEFSEGWPSRRTRRTIEADGSRSISAKSNSAPSVNSNVNLDRNDEQARLARELVGALRSDPDMSCTPRNYMDMETIYTAGCQTFIKSWLDSSAHILFVTGFCVLTVLKFCSVVLLRLEIQEMIHKIRVLKGMATEYNALHDLEAYLPRPSVCAQAAELTLSGVAPAMQSPSSVAAAQQQQQQQQQQQAALAAASLATHAACERQASCGGAHSPVSYSRLGSGSFSEAVVAATAAAHQQVGINQLGLAATGRTASMKAVAALSNHMLTPSLCPRSSSAHLNAAAALSLALNAQQQQPALSTLRSLDLFGQATQNAIMSRRHTAVSVCPAAAAAAATAAHHLMSRRGTYVANPVFNAAPLISSGLNLYQHRHSAHTLGGIGAVGAALLKPPPLKQMIGQHQQQTIENQSSVDSGATTAGSSTGAQGTPQCRIMRSSGGSQQLLSLAYPFKRQSSGGAQSACNFSLDLTPPSITESRRSIH